MRLIATWTATLVVLSSAALPAQEWIDFVNRDDGFRVNFPAQPKVTNTTYTSEYGATLDAVLGMLRRGAVRSENRGAA